jgi:hypothetical protein
MANSKLLNREVPFPENLLPVMKRNLGGELEFATQIKNFIEDRNISYNDLRNIVKNYRTYNSREKLEHGGDVFYKWATATLDRLTRTVERSKENLSLAGKSNAYIKQHEKNVTGKANTEKPIYESEKKITKIYISEDILKKLNK